MKKIGSCVSPIPGLLAGVVSGLVLQIPIKFQLVSNHGYPLIQGFGAPLIYGHPLVLGGLATLFLGWRRRWTIREAAVSTLWGFLGVFVMAVATQFYEGFAVLVYGPIPAPFAFVGTGLALSLVNWLHDRTYRAKYPSPRT